MQQQPTLTTTTITTTITINKSTVIQQFNHSINHCIHTSSNLSSIQPYIPMITNINISLHFYFTNWFTTAQAQNITLQTTPDQHPRNCIPLDKISKVKQITKMEHHKCIFFCYPCSSHQQQENLMKILGFVEHSTSSFACDIVLVHPIAPFDRH